MKDNILKIQTECTHEEIVVHPGKLIKEAIILTLANEAQVDTVILRKLLDCKCDVTPEISERLGKIFGLDKNYLLDIQEKFDEQSKPDIIC